MPIAKYYGGHGEKVMRSMMKTYGSKKAAKRVFYATANKRKSLKDHTAKMVRDGRLRKA